MGCTGRRKAKQKKKKKQKISAPALSFTVYEMLCFELFTVNYQYSERRSDYIRYACSGAASG